MSIDYKNDITKYLTAEKFNDWGKKGDSRYKEILKTLNVLTYENISEVFEGDNHILKFLWYKLLVCKNMPAYQSDCDKAFFGKLNLPSFVPSELVNDWQRKKANWSPDTANSYAELFKRFLNFYLPDIFPRKEGNDRDNIRLKTEYTKNLLSELIIHSTYKKLKECHKNIAYDNQLILYSHLIFFQEELFRQLEDNCDKDALQSMQDFAKLTHTPGNFILVRPGENFVKNNRYGDFIDLYIEDQNENFIKGQHLGMYNEPLFRRRGYQVFPDKKSLMTCVDNINKKIIQREKELNR